MKISIKNILLLLAIILCFAVMATVFNGYGDTAKSLTYGEVLSYLDGDAVESFVIDSDGATMMLKVREVNAEGKESLVTYTYRLANYVQMETIEAKAQEALAEGRLGSYDYKAPTETPWILAYLPYILVGIGLIVLVVIMVRSSAGKGGKMGSFARAKTKTADDAKNPVKFADVAGADEEKEELKEVVEFLKAPEKFVRLGARIPRGVLLVGPPGTGKTLLAKAVAGEAGVPFYSISGSDFVEMYVGVGASRVRDLFDTARKSPASIIFIDEIDAVGRQRGTGLGGGHDEREQTLNQLLVEMDGFGTHEGVIVMAATNRPDILDPALLRPGRFDRQVTVNYPDLCGREAILRVHVRNKPLEGNVDLAKIAQSTAGFTGADLANLLNEAALLAARMGKSLIGMEEIEKATLKVMVGTEKKTSRLSEREKRNTAYHEAGHAILSHVLPTQDPVRRISIIPAGRALGYTLSVPEQDKFSVYKSELCEQIAMLLGGRAAEDIIFGDISGGASNDIQRATHIAQTMVTRYGMSDSLGTVLLGGDHSEAEVFLGRDFASSKNYSDETARLIDMEIKRFIDEGYALAKKVLTENMAKLHFIAEYLAKYEVMDGEQFAYAMAHEDVTDDDLLSMIDKRRRQSDEENRIAEEDEKKASEENAEALPEAVDDAADDTTAESKDTNE